jgi:hypothetical protein
MTLTDDDKDRLRILVQHAMAEVEAAVEPGAMILPATVEDAMGLITSYEWGKDFLARLGACDHVWERHVPGLQRCGRCREWKNT